MNTLRRSETFDQHVGGYLNSTTAPRADRDTLEKTTLRWLWLAVYSLAAAGFLSLFLAFARTPFIQNLFSSQDLFRTILVVHVDLSVLIWFFAVCGVVWSLLTRRVTFWSRLAFGLTLSGTVMLSLSPFVGADKPLMNNYVPVLQHPWFYLSLLLVCAGMVLHAVLFLLHRPRSGHLLDFAMRLAAGSILLAVMCVGLAYMTIPATIEGEHYFELLFWGGGHVLQFAWTLLMLVAWVWLASVANDRAVVGPRLGSLLFVLVVAPLLVLPWLLQQPVESESYLHGFTLLMRWGGLGSVPLALLVVRNLMQGRCARADYRVFRATLLCSMSLFAAGGMLGYMISGSNTIIPAHYHGSIVGVTLACMGLIYYALKKVGCAITLPRTALWQPYVYASGQLLHIMGLAWSGGYGMQRKVSGTAQELDRIQEVAAMGIMGMGGLISVIGGVMFLVVTIAALRSHLPSRNAAPALPVAAH